MQGIKGIDVSRWQGDINWNAVKGNVNFAIIKCGGSDDGYYIDRKFEQNYSGAKAAGVPVGAYWFSAAKSEAEARKDAEHCINALKGKTFEYPIWFDIERKDQFALGKAKCSAIVKAFCDALEAAGYFVGVYSYKSELENSISAEVRHRYAVWVAHFYVAKTTYSGQYGIWQYSDKGRISGINGDVDLDLCYCDYPTIIKNKGLNGFKSASSQPETKPPKEEPKKEAYTSYTVKKGDTLWDIAVKYLGNGSRYKEIMKASGITSETIYPKQVLKIPAK